MNIAPYFVTKLPDYKHKGKQMRPANAPKDAARSRKLQDGNKLKSAATQERLKPKLGEPQTDRVQIRQELAHARAQGSGKATQDPKVEVRFKKSFENVAADHSTRIADVTTTVEQKNKRGNKELDAFESVFRDNSTFPLVWMDNLKHQCRKFTGPVVLESVGAMDTPQGAAALAWQTAQLSADAPNETTEKATAAGAKALNELAHAVWDRLIPPAGSTEPTSEEAAGKQAFNQLPTLLKDSLVELGKGVVASEVFRKAHPESQSKLLHNAAVMAFFQGIQETFKPDQTRLTELRKLPNGKDRPRNTLTESEKEELVSLTTQLSHFQKLSLAGSFLCGINAKLKWPEWLKLSDADKQRGRAFFQAWENHLVANSGWNIPTALQLKPDADSRALRANARSGLSNPDIRLLIKVDRGNKQESTETLNELPNLLQQAGIKPVPDDMQGAIGNFDRYIRKVAYRPGGLNNKAVLDQQTRWEISKQEDGSVVATYSIRQQHAAAVNTTMTLAPKQASDDTQSISTAAVTGKIVFQKDGSWEVRSPMIHVAPEFRQAAVASEQE